MKREAVLHIGPMKTGSTSIQAWLRKNRKALAARGIGVPRGFGAANMSALTTIAGSAARNTALPPDDAERWDGLVKELEAWPESIGTVIMSGEMMGQRLRKVSLVAGLKRALDPYFDRYRIIVYLRRQDEMSVSRYNTLLRNNSSETLSLLDDPVDFEEMLRIWSEVFGREAIIPRLFARSELVGNDILADFASALGIAADGLEFDVGTRNPSYVPKAQEFLSALVEHTRRTGLAQDLSRLPNYIVMTQVLRREFAGKGLLPARKEAIAFVREVAASNEAVRSAWFPERERLFGDDFSQYPEERTGAPDAAALLSVAIPVVAELLAKSAARVAPEGTAEPGRRRRRSVPVELLPRPGHRTLRQPETGEPETIIDLAAPDQNVVAKVARMLWRIDNLDALKEVPFADRKVRWAEARDTYVTLSGQFLTSIARERIGMTIRAETELDDADISLDVEDDETEPA